MSSAIRASTTTNNAYTGMPWLKERAHSSDDKDYLSFSDSESDADLDYTNFISKLLAQPARNEKENLIETGNGGSNFDGDNDN
eukprot:8615646-Ditylum_brightwellii.AAC.1